MVRLRLPARVADALRAAGGPLPEADLEALNLAAFLRDGQKVEVPRKPAEGEGRPGRVSPSPRGPKRGRKEGLPLRRLEALVGRLERLLEGRRPPPVSPSRPIDLNLASEEELRLLPGVGPALARAIVERRRRKGPFRSVEELLEVAGIGPRKLERLRPLLVVREEWELRGSQPFPVDINSATEEELRRIPGVGVALARAILGWRERNGPFGSVDELLSVPGIGPKTLERLRPFVVARRPKEPLNLLAASLREVASLPGVSEEMALRIVMLRAEGRLKSLEDLLSVEGFTKELLERLRGWICVEPLKGRGRKTSPPSEPPWEAETETSPPPPSHQSGPEGGPP